jgi:hypothetical protein
MSTSLIDRLEARNKRRRTAGVAGRVDLRVSRLTGLSSAFYARFGMDDPWADQLDEPTHDDEGMNFLSGKRYHARMKRLALSRWWRERRRHDFQARRPGRETAARKRFPGEPRRGFSWGIALSESAMVLPPPVVQPTDEGDEEVEASPVRRVSGWGNRATVSNSPWLVTPWTPARVAKPKPRAVAPEVVVVDRTQEPALRPSVRVRGAARRRTDNWDRPTDRVGKRLAATAAGRDPVVQAVQAAAPLLNERGRQELARVLQRTVTLDVRTRIIEVQKVIRKVTTSRVIREIVEDIAPQARPSRVARTRGRSSGLRPVMARSATFSDAAAAAAPDRPVAAAVSRGSVDSVRLAAAPVRRTSGASPSVRATRGARVVRTAAGAYIAASTHRTPGTEFEGAQAFTTDRSAWTGARTGTASDWTATSDRSAHSTRSGTTAQRDWFGAAVATTPATEWAGARAFRTPGGDWAGASSVTTPSSPFRKSALHRTARGSFVGARSGTTPSSEWTPARLGSSNWAAERLESTGRPGKSRGGRKSLLPRMAPRTAPEGVLVVHAETMEEAEVLAERIKHMGLKTRISKSPWHVSSFTGARVAEKKPRTSPAVAAAERATSLPRLAQSVTRVLTRDVAPARESRGPLVHARTSPVSTATVIRHVYEDGTEVEGGSPDRQSTPRGAWKGARSFTTSAADWTGASTATPRVSGWTGARVGTTASTDWEGARSGTTASSDWTGARSGTTAGRAWSGARSGRTRATGWSGAQSFVTPDGEWAAARTATTRPTDWVGARVAFGEGSGAYRGAFSTKTGRTDWAGAGVFSTPRGAWNGARRTRTPLGWHSSPEMGLPERDFNGTLADMAHGTPSAGLPGWAERGDRPHRIRASGELIQQLANARDPAAVVDIIVNRGAELRNTRLPKPVIQVIEQIQTVSREGGDAKQGLQDRVRDARSSLNGAPRRGQFKRGTRSSNRVINGWTGLRPGSSASTSQSAVGADKVMKLAEKLKSLIHLAKGGNVAEAQRHAKLAHANRPDKSIEKGGDVASSETAARQSVDIEALGREVLEVVNRELEMRQERRQEDNDVNIWW